MLAAGSTIAGRYRLASLIGEGGMASVWRAEDQTLRRSVAIKLLYFRAHRDPQATVDQFLREARIAASIQHRNVIHTVDFGTTEDSVPYMVMELLEGESMAERLERSPRLGMEEVLRIASLTLRGLAAVHDAGIVHRDLKPQNIFLQRDADAVYPKILDFGISRSLRSAGERPSAVATQQGLVIGTPHYMAPEQARGEAEIDKRADIYSMGAIIYEAVTGQLPFDAENPGELLVKIISNVAPSMRSICPGVPEVLSDCVAQAMAHPREHRFVDAIAFRRALQSAADSIFPRAAGPVTSEAPGHLAAATFGRAATPMPERAMLTLEDERPKQAWGDFEGLAGRSESPVPEPLLRTSLARSAASSPGTAAPEVVARAAVRSNGGGVAEISTRPQNGPMLGDSPLDAFGGSQALAMDLDLDYGPTSNAPRISRHSPTPRGAKRTSGVNRVAYQDVKSEEKPPRDARTALWIAPVAVLILALLLLLAPRLFSTPPPDEAAARQREAENPATRGSKRHLTPARPADLAKTPPALRELQY
jgi:serine/threonine protein kinase